MPTETSRPKKLTKRQKAALEPFALLLAGLNTMPTKEIETLYAGCRAVSETNCWWATYQAAHAILPSVVREMTRRAKPKANAERRPGQ